MQKYRMLVLTDHRGHSAENSIYSLLLALRNHPACESIAVASRGNTFNHAFFKNHRDQHLFVSPVDASFGFYQDGRRFNHFMRRARVSDYDVILLRLPPPLTDSFWDFLTSSYPDHRIINRPSGIRETSSKAFLLQFPDLCPEMKLCRSVEDTLAFSNRFPVVLKPLRNYGGRGILRIEDGKVWEGNQYVQLEDWLKGLADQEVTFLGMRFLPNVSKGDKRIVVCNGEVLGASLRLPPEGSWMCNAAQGGIPHAATLTPEEEHIARRLSPELTRRGVVMFGFDTLTDDDGRRVLSEVNTVSIGGLAQMGRLSGQPVVRRAAELIWKYTKTKIYGESNAIR